MTAARLASGLDDAGDGLRGIGGYQLERVVTVEETVIEAVGTRSLLIGPASA
ncbi:MAG: hypothetical protein R2853_06325 [Thermomicrobiales bacterium]|nr:hypothetical protein [Thermomicrobiales bacterium]